MKELIKVAEELYKQIDKAQVHLINARQQRTPFSRLSLTTICVGVRNSPERIFLSDLKKKILSGLASFCSYPQRLRERGLGFYPLLSEQSFESDFRFYLVSRGGWFRGV